MKKILILGATGFIGRNLREELLKDSMLEVSSPTHSELDLLDERATEEYLKAGQYDVVFHCAIYNPKQNEDHDEIVKKDMALYYNVRKYTQYFGKMIYLGSGAEYDKRHPIIKVEEEEIGKSIPASAYGFAKYEIGKDIEQSENIYNFRVFGMFGYGEDWRTTFISNAICKSLYGYPISIRKDVEFTYMWVKDFCQIAKWAIDADLKYHTYNMGTGHTYKLSELAELVRKVSGNTMPVFICEEGIGNEYTASGSRLRSECTGWSQTSVEAAIAMLYNEYKKHKEEISLRTLIYGE